MKDKIKIEVKITKYRRNRTVAMITLDNNEAKKEIIRKKKSKEENFYLK